jgi:hypothetical protein
MKFYCLWVNCNPGLTTDSWSDAAPDHLAARALKHLAQPLVLGRAFGLFAAGAAPDVFDGQRLCGECSR